MTLGHFQVCRPSSVDEACDLRRSYGDEAVLYAGGTEVLLAMNLGLARWPYLIDLKRVQELRGIEVRDGCLRIGALATHWELERSAEVRRLLPALAQLEGGVGNVRVRVAGTLVGNLCFGDPHADPPALLFALQAQIEIADGTSRRLVGMERFMTGAFANTLAPNELVLAVLIPLPPADTRVAYVNFRILERPTAGAAVVGRLDQGRFVEAPRVFVGALDGVPRRIDAGSLQGADAADTDAVSKVAESASAAVDPIADLAGSAEYKRHLAGVITRRAVQKALTGVAT